MGLDNGFVIRNMSLEQIEKIPSFIKFDIWGDNDIEIAYWRKCWGIRNEIINTLHLSQDGGTFSIDAEDIPAILQKLYLFLSDEYWRLFGKSIWEYEEYREKLVNNILNLKWLYSFMKENPNIKVDFYDSY